ncbi:hypothetical protein [Nannocystis pusilla]|uniref:hypothetical protein n=1 Tax=Nannocystis pusilla TaxID=889268 RepID=UPI003DA45457
MRFISAKDFFAASIAARFFSRNSPRVGFELHPASARNATQERMRLDDERGMGVMRGNVSSGWGGRQAVNNPRAGPRRERNQHGPPGHAAGHRAVAVVQAVNDVQPGRSRW